MGKILEVFPPSARRLNTTTSTTESTLSVDEYEGVYSIRTAWRIRLLPRRRSSCLPTMGRTSVMSPWRTGKSHPQQPTPSRPQSRMSRSQGRVDPV
ncbi:hypothetical protein JG688_00018517, partial [Phytophthora aleatoria]